MGIKTALDTFLANSFETAVDQSTAASWGGSGYSVELFDNGTYRVLWNQQIGNLYDSPGLILPVPALTEDEWSEDPALRFYDNAREAFIENYREHLLANVEVQDFIAFAGEVNP